MQSIIELAKEMRDLQEQKDSMDEAWKALTKRIDEIRLKLIPDLMAEQEIRTLTIDGVGRVQLTSDVYASITEKAAGYDWLRDNGYDGLIQPYVQPSTFKAEVKRGLKEGVEFPENLFSITPFMRASIVKK
jgi:hypothetical protein